MIQNMKVPFPKNSYMKKIEVNEADIDIDFGQKQKIALLFVNLNERYWPYFKQVVEDCRVNFLPHHHVSYFVWSDMPQTEVPHGVTLIHTDAIEWPAPTLMRYHLFLQEEEKLKEYDHIFYLDSDMRVVDRISDEILSDGLLAAEHPMYSLRKEYIPPYEPNKESTAYIPRPGKVMDENGAKRFKPFYFAGGFQGGKAKEFIQAMKVMKQNIDKDFNKNYTAIWNDESHWNRYLFDYQGPLSVMPPSYIYPDSLIKEYYEPIWGRSYVPKIITITKPFTLSRQGADNINEYLGREKGPPRFECETCRDTFEVAGHVVQRVVECNGPGKPHQLDMRKI